MEDEALQARAARVERHLAGGHFNRALVDLLWCATHLGSKGEHSGESTVYSNIARVYDKLANVPKSLMYHDKAVRAATAAGNASLRCRSLLELSAAHLRAEQASDALDAASSAYQAINKSGEPDEAALVRASTMALASALYANGELERALKYHSSHLKLCLAVSVSAARRSGAVCDAPTRVRSPRQADDKDGLACAYGNLSLVYRAKGDLSKAAECAEKDLDIQHEMRHLEGERAACQNLAAALYAMAHFPRAHEIAERTRVLALQLHDRAAEAKAYSLLGQIALAMGRPRDALRYYQVCVGRARVARPVTHSTPAAAPRRPHRVSEMPPR